MFLAILELQVEEKKKNSSEKNCFDNVVSDFCKNGLICPKKMFLKFGFQGGKFWPLRDLWLNLHMVLGILELRGGKNYKFRGKSFDNLVSDLWKKYFFTEHKSLYKKEEKNCPQGKKILGGFLDRIGLGAISV